MPRDFSRIDRVADTLQKELAYLIQQEMQDANLGIVTLTQVRVSKDFSLAKVFVSILFKENEAKKTIQTLNKAAGFLRGLLAKRVRLRRMPALVFVYDETTVKAHRLHKLIDTAHKEDDLPPDEPT